MHLDRAAFLRRLLVLPAATLPSARLLVPPANAAAPPVLSDGEQFYQSDDKSWDVVLPKGWTVAPGDPRRNFPEHVFSVSAKKGKSAFDVTVDLKGAKGKYGANLDTLGKTPEAQASAILAQSVPGASLVSVERKVGSGYGDGYGEQRRAKYLEIAYKTAAGQPRLMRANVVSSRLYKLDAVDGGDAPELRSIIDSFTAWPTNLICQGQSNSGSVPVAGSCY